MNKIPVVGCSFAPLVLLLRQKQQQQKVLFFFFAKRSLVTLIRSWGKRSASNCKFFFSLSLSTPPPPPLSLSVSLNLKLGLYVSLHFTVFWLSAVCFSSVGRNFFLFVGTRVTQDCKRSKQSSEQWMWKRKREQKEKRNPHYEVDNDDK